MEHTPGPWEVDGPWQVETDLSRFGMGERRTDWRVHGFIGKPSRTIAEVGGWKDRPNAEADARLIAAAPELLEAAEEILDVSGYRLTQDRRPGTMLEKLLQAVEKATGGE
ncbi:hypothetical protein LCGC14_1198020 [marine sediment metagenome]|uniref:Uncharacterized protein n=1 Tax=marine sediment metagenome TaxID=412755 RepID=A0A0F9M519_9ZZZZ